MLAVIDSVPDWDVRTACRVTTVVTACYTCWAEHSRAMGNTASNTNGRGMPERMRHDEHPGSGHVSPAHSSLRTKKRSIELPDLAPLGSHRASVVRHANPPRSAAIAIPNAAHVPISSRPVNDILSSDNLASDVSLSRLHSPSRRHTPSSSLQAIYDQSTVPIDALSASDGPFVEETVHSSIPIGLPPVLLQDFRDDSSMSIHDLYPVLVSWYGGGHNVMLARAGDDDWKGRAPMIQDRANPKHFSVTICLPPGTHHVRFLVDDQWCVSDDMLTAVDDEGSLANYIDVTPTSPADGTPGAMSATPAVEPTYLVPGASFWSASSSDITEAAQAILHMDPLHAVNHKNAVVAAAHRSRPEWTTTIPPELVAAAEVEDAWISGNNSESGRPASPYASCLPRPPSLPPHLERLILNTPVSRTQGGPGSASGSPVRGEARAHGRRYRAHVADLASVALLPTAPTAGGIPVTTASGTDVARGVSTSLERLPVPLSRLSQELSTENSESRQSETERLIPPSPGHSHHHQSTTRHQHVAGPDDSAMADDNSVLPVPSHVVLHHLCTTAIKHDVLAVATTARYRRKYLSVVYYKPT
ncbi:hypothetical protein FISHEDRAFT_72749 [Fistulina hepatica ATCC 64428]|nr:hypothetical protein FISHEDRAFT_72749 [Fistulina hepatica ATCC 64428]